MTVSGNEYQVVARGDMAKLLAMSAVGDMIQIFGSIEPHKWTVQDHTQRWIANIEATRVQIVWPHQQKTN